MARDNSVKTGGTTPRTVECLSVAGSSDMEWTEFHMHVTIVGLLKVGHSTVKIHILLRPLEVKKRLYCVKLFKETGNVYDHLQASQSKNVVNAVHA